MAAPIQVDKTTYAIVDFLEWQRQGSLDLQPYYQRRSVWNPRVKSLLIDSLLRGYPMPLVFLHNRLDVATSKTVRQVVDGQQRLRTILSFIDIDTIQDPEEWDRFTVIRAHNRDFAGLGFQQLPPEVQGQILQTAVSVNILPSDIDDVTVLTIFQRMNSTGFKLNDQEIRNATYFGEFKESAYELAYSQNQRWQEWGIFSRQDVAQMKEVELASDLMGFLIAGVAAKSKTALDKLYKENESEFARRAVVEEEFLTTFERLQEVYGAGGSRSTLKRFRTTAWFYVVFAVLSGRYGAVSPATLVGALERAEVALRDEEPEENLLKVLRGATADKASRNARIEYVIGLLGGE